MSDGGSLNLIRTRAAAVRALVVPDWLAEVVRPRPAPLPWPQMIRAALAICVPLSVALALGRGTLGVLDRGGVAAFGGQRPFHRPAAGADRRAQHRLRRVAHRPVHLRRPEPADHALAALLPYGRSRNYGLLSTFLTPLVVLLIDVLSPRGWRLAEDRLIDTLVGCAIVLLIGFAPWPMSWCAHLPQQFAVTALVCAGIWSRPCLVGSMTRLPLRIPRWLCPRLSPGLRLTRGCGGQPTGPWPTCARSSRAPCPSRPRLVGVPPPGGPRRSASNR